MSVQAIWMISVLTISPTDVYHLQEVHQSSLKDLEKANKVFILFDKWLW